MATVPVYTISPSSVHGTGIHVFVDRIPGSLIISEKPLLEWLTPGVVMVNEQIND